MSTIFTLLKTNNRHFDISEFLISQGHAHNQSWKYPPILPFGSCSLMKKYIHERSAELPDICIFDFNLRSDTTGEDALKCIQKMNLFSASMPVIYLLGKDRGVTLNNKTSYVYWEENDSLSEKIKQDLVVAINEILRPKTGFFDKVIKSI